MAPKRMPKPTASQQSSASSDDTFQAAMAEQLLAAQEKKKKEKERRFLAGAKKRIADETAAAAEDFNNSLAAVNATFDNFVQQYAQCEDEIRRLWTRLEAEQRRMVQLAHARRALNVQADRDRQEAQVAGLAKMGAACKDTESLIALIDPPASET
ncbi:hypothetical protein HDZ31DRAFT_67481 [Schizophyllum fasciatum]